MAARVLGVIALATIAGGVAWVALRSRGEPAADPTRSTALTSGTSNPSVAAGSSPTLDPATAGSGDQPTLAVEPGPTPAQIYAGETRDEAWAPTTEAEIRRRWKAIRGAKLDEADCRETRCALTVSGSEADVGKTIADLESDRGLHGYAETILLTAPEKRSDGTIILRAIASFRR